ncbi:Diguanylate cyclase/phosphodiesterase with PAS/PAC sensor(S) [Thiocapsa sp. KS1]|nr:EAL domain-containing protein [Thiocapsa sp. KS1]CRI63115.1 Diguanylate cyclase/phosphodiesterase with PAS/PAC sensor(S) [Thiocapsa sp. KS1]
MQNKGFGLLLWLVLTACVTGTNALAAEKTLAFGIAAYRPEAVMLPQWRPLADYLERTLPGYRISLRILEPEALEQAAKRGELDLVLTNPAHYIAIRSSNLLSGAIATLVRREGDLALAVLGGVIFTAEDRDDIDSLEDLAGKQIALSGRYNLGGYAAPMTELRARGIGPDRIRILVFGAPHDRAIEAVLSGAADAGFVRTGIIEQMRREGRLTKPLKILAPRHLPGFPFALSTDLYPEWPVVALPSAGEVASRRIAGALLALEPDDPAAGAAGIMGFTIPADYTTVEELLRTNRMPPFEHQPPIRWHDIWVQHRFALIATPAAFVAILGLALWLSLTNRHLSAERSRALTLGQRLEREHAHLETLVQTIPDLVWLKDLDGVYLACNPRFEAFFGAPRQQIIGKTDYDFTTRDTADLFREFDRRAMCAEGPCTNEEWVTFARDGHRELLETTKVAMRDTNGALIGVLGIGHDITERKRIEHDLRSITEYAAEGIWTSGLDHRYLYANPAALAMTGHTLEELQGMRIEDLAAPEEHERLAEHFAHMRTVGAVDHRLWKLKRKDGSLLEVELTAQRLPDDRLLAVGRDLTHLRNHEEALFRAIYYDALTGLPNRTLMLERLEQSRLRACRDQSHLALGFLDLDRFGVVNETYGHARGDRILAEIALRLRATLRPGDTLARIGGDEFALLMDALPHPEAASAVIERLLTELATPLAFHGDTVRVSASLGLTIFPEDDGDSETLLRHATQAMYRAKELGRNRIHLFDVAQDQALLARIDDLKRFREAIEHHELALHYQPKVDLDTGDIVGAEALIRWQHPERGLLLPADFLTLVDGSELEIRLSEWVITHALAQMTAWHASGLRLSVSINLPAAHLLLPGFADWLAAALSRHPDLTAHSLELEILESAAIADMDIAVETLTAIKILGVDVSLDDFGTGFSSLAYFRRLPVDTLKIDRSFVSDMLVDPNALGVVEHVIRLAKIFDRNVIAEGLETIDDWIALRLLGCDQAQGFGIAHPMPAEAVPGWLDAWRSAEIRRDMPARNCTGSDATLVVAGIIHRRWFRALTAAVETGNASDVGIFDAGQCPFGKWYRGIGERRYAGLPDFEVIDDIHRRAHRIAEEIVERLVCGDACAARAQLPQLQTTCDALLEHIDRLAAYTQERAARPAHPPPPAEPAKADYT